MGVVVALLSGTWLSGQQRALAEKVVRLHVIGASDGEEDQRVKLLARDAVLAKAAPLLERVNSREEAMAVLAGHLGELAKAGAEAAGTTASAGLEEQAWFPTKRYDDFALPAGRYPALKITLGEGKGQNWWCVVYPALCVSPVVETAAEAGGFSEEQIKLITGESQSYEIKFKALELWDRLTRGR